MRRIRWNPTAVIDYNENIDYLLEKWSEKAAQQFIDEVSHIEFILRQGNVDFQNTDIEGVNRFVFRKQITLFYRISDKNQVEFLRFWNNNKNIRNLNF
jgi:plasmid stabilization system protein ParE